MSSFIKQLCQRKTGCKLSSSSTSLDHGLFGGSTEYARFFRANPALQLVLTNLSRRFILRLGEVGNLAICGLEIGKFSFQKS